MSDSKKDSNSPPLSRTAMTWIGLLVVLALCWLLNIVFGMIGPRIDLTDANLFTLSDGSKRILSRLETPVQINYYSTEDTMSPGEADTARRVEDLLENLVSAAPKGMLTVKKFNPEPATDAEDSARLDGVRQGMSGETGNPVYFGMAVKCLDASERVIFPTERGGLMNAAEQRAEYDILRAITRVHGGEERHLRVMTSLSIAGGMGANFQAPPTPAWYIYQQLGQDFEVEVIAPTVAEIPADTDVLLIIHPHDVTDEAQFAIDQYLLKGGNVIAMVDPNFFFAEMMGQPAQMPGMPPQGGPPATSDLPALFKAWGVSYDSTKVLADLDFGGQIGRNFAPTFLNLDRKAITKAGQEEPLTKSIKNLAMLTTGAFEVTPPEGVTATTLVRSSAMNKFVSPFDADPRQEENIQRIRQNFESTNKYQALVVRLSGNFKTAFPDGDPSKPAEEEKSEDDEKKSADKKADAKKADDKKSEDDKEKPEEETAAPALKESTEPGNVLLIADVDMIFDQLCVQYIPLGNMRLAQPTGDNPTLLQNAADQLSGDPDLMEVRSRQNLRREFNVLAEWRAEAEAAFSAEVATLNEKLKESQERMNKIAANLPEGIDVDNLPVEIQEEEEKLQREVVNFQKRVRDLEKEVSKVYRSRISFFKFASTAIIPLLVVVIGLIVFIARRMKVAAR